LAPDVDPCTHACRIQAANGTRWHYSTVAVVDQYMTLKTQNPTKFKALTPQAIKLVFLVAQSRINAKLTELGDSAAAVCNDVVMNICVATSKSLDHDLAAMQVVLDNHFTANIKKFGDDFEADFSARQVAVDNRRDMASTKTRPTDADHVAAPAALDRDRECVATPAVPSADTVEDVRKVGDGPHDIFRDETTPEDPALPLKSRVPQSPPPWKGLSPSPPPHSGEKSVKRRRIDAAADGDNDMDGVQG
jgi:hypothetical protein